MKELQRDVGQSVFTNDMLLKISEIIVKKYIKIGYVKSTDYKDIRQTLIEKYCAKRQHIESLYDNRALPSTYMSVVLYKMLLEVLRSDTSGRNNFALYQKNVMLAKPRYELSPEERLVLANEAEYLKRVIASFADKTPKVLLFCKMFFRINPTEDDLRAYVGDDNIDQYLAFVKVSANDKDKDVFALLCDLCNRVEGKNNMPDAVRMFVNKTVDAILVRLNGSRRADYNRETLGLLFEYSYDFIHRQL